MCNLNALFDRLKKKLAMRQVLLSVLFSAFIIFFFDNSLEGQSDFDTLSSNIEMPRAIIVQSGYVQQSNSLNSSRNSSGSKIINIGYIHNFKNGRESLGANLFYNQKDIISTQEFWVQADSTLIDIGKLNKRFELGIDFFRYKNLYSSSLFNLGFKYGVGYVWNKPSFKPYLDVSEYTEFYHGLRFPIDAFVTFRIFNKCHLFFDVNIIHVDIGGSYRYIEYDGEENSQFTFLDVNIFIPYYRLKHAHFGLMYAF